MKEGEFLENLPEEEKRRLAYIEGREDLFKTKVLEIEKDDDSPGQETKNIVVISRDPGSANALLPVAELLNRKRDIKIKVLTDGRAQEIFQGKFKTKDITPDGNVFKIAEAVGSSDIVLIDASEESGAEMFFSATFPEVPKVLVEDYYTNASPYLRKLKERNLPFPQKICVIDEEAKKIIIGEFPELEDAIEITGQPAFDKFTKEDTEKIAKEAREDLGIKPEEKLVAFMSSMETTELVQKLAEELSKVGGKFKFTFRIHPRDNTPLEDFEKKFKDLGIDYVGTMQLPTDEIGAASDLVITTISTEGLHAICRGKPSINIVDARFMREGENFIMPPSVKLGASIGLDRIENLAPVAEKLLDLESKENKALQSGMKKHYSIDGKNAKRVADVVEKLLNF